MTKFMTKFMADKFMATRLDVEHCQSLSDPNPHIS